MPGPACRCDGRIALHWPDHHEQLEAPCLGHGCPEAWLTALYTWGPLQREQAAVLSDTSQQSVALLSALARLLARTVLETERTRVQRQKQVVHLYPCCPLLLPSRRPAHSTTPPVKAARVLAPAEQVVAEQVVAELVLPRAPARPPLRRIRHRRCAAASPAAAQPPSAPPAAAAVARAAHGARAARPPARRRCRRRQARRSHAAQARGRS
jgi:hypothetical protein